MRIMLVDDRSELLFLYKEILEIEGYWVDFALNGLQAVEKYERLLKEGLKPDIVLMDYRMPVKNGLEATIEILKIDKSAIIIFTSADVNVKSEALKNGVKAFKQKPFSIKVLIENIEKYVK